MGCRQPERGGALREWWRGHNSEMQAPTLVVGLEEEGGRNASGAPDTRYCFFCFHGNASSRMQT